MINKLMAALLLAGVLGSISGCNTVEGMGKDMERAGEATRDTAQDVKKKM